MRNILYQKNSDLLNEIKKIELKLDSIEISDELKKYHEFILNSCKIMKKKIKLNLKELDYGIDSILIDILSNTQEIKRNFQLYNQKYIILRKTILDFIPKNSTLIYSKQ